MGIRSIVEELVDKIKEYIESENPKTPYSDEKLKALLEKGDLCIEKNDCEI